MHRAAPYLLGFSSFPANSYIPLAVLPRAAPICWDLLRFCMIPIFDGHSAFVPHLHVIFHSARARHLAA
jgi:hypothetical protein